VDEIFRWLWALTDRSVMSVVINCSLRNWLSCATLLLAYWQSWISAYFTSDVWAHFHVQMHCIWHL